jgi:hypothetical protein
VDDHPFTFQLSSRRTPIPSHTNRDGDADQQRAEPNLYPGNRGLDWVAPETAVIAARVRRGKRAWTTAAVAAVASAGAWTSGCGAAMAPRATRRGPRAGRCSERPPEASPASAASRCPVPPARSERRRQ